MSYLTIAIIAIDIAFAVTLLGAIRWLWKTTMR